MGVKWDEACVAVRRGAEACGGEGKAEPASALAPVEALHEVAVQERERRGEARGALLDDGPPRADEQQQVHERDAQRVEAQRQDGDAHDRLVLGALADDAVVGLEEGFFALRAWGVEG